jgi:predicted amidohydrolase YtcJ
VRDFKELRAALQSAQPRFGWIRGVEYDESVAGPLDRKVLDAIAVNAAVRVQHRSGSLWSLNSRGVEKLGLEDTTLDGIERDGAGQVTGRLWRLDAWLRERLGSDVTPDLRGLSKRLASFGITGVTDATPDLTSEGLRMLTTGGLCQRLMILGTEREIATHGVVAGPRKIVVADHCLPAFDELSQLIRESRPRPVAIHSVTRVSLFLTLSVLAELGSVAGDRIEHAAVAPPEAVKAISDLGLAVVTQPSFIAQHGDDYLERVSPEDQEFLWPFRTLLRNGVPVGCSSDAPYGNLDPWLSIRSAVERRSPSGRIVVGAERVSASEALNGFLCEPASPGGAPSGVKPGRPADLALLDRPLRQSLKHPSHERILMTLISGRIVYNKIDDISEPIGAPVGL